MIACTQCNILIVIADNTQTKYERLRVAISDPVCREKVSLVFFSLSSGNEQSFSLFNQTDYMCIFKPWLIFFLQTKTVFISECCQIQVNYTQKCAWTQLIQIQMKLLHLCQSAAQALPAVWIQRYSLQEPRWWSFNPTHNVLIGELFLRPAKKAAVSATTVLCKWAMQVVIHRSGTRLGKIGLITNNRDWELLPSIWAVVCAEDQHWNTEHSQRKQHDFRKGANNNDITLLPFMPFLCTNSPKLGLHRIYFSTFPDKPTATVRRFWT